MPQSYTEYRAVIRRPWNILDPAEFKERGWMEYTSGPIRDKKMLGSLRSEETHAYIHHWEWRSVVAEDWEWEGSGE